MPGGTRDVMREHRERMARALGHRPAGEEHRVIVDHEALAACAPGEHEWKNLTGYLGLDQLDAADTRLPAPLRQLLQCSETSAQGAPAWSWMLLIGVVSAVEIGLLIGVRTGWIRSDVLAASMGLALATIMFGVILLDHLFSDENCPSLQRRDAALAQLTERPFIVTVGDVMVENLPGHAWLRARRLELGDAHDKAASRLREAKELKVRIVKLREELGLDKQDAQVAALKAIIRDEKHLMHRIEKVRATVEERLAEGEHRLTRLRKRAELAALQSKASELTGQDDAPERVAADLEMETDDLRSAWDDLRGDIADEEARWSAIAEVHAAS